MNIKEVEEKTGLQRSNIRFYEKEGLIAPKRNKGNGYREYSEQEVSDIKKIAYLRTLGISIESIRNIIEKEVLLHDVIREQAQSLEHQMTDLRNAKAMCEKMMLDEKINFEELEIERYVPDLEEQWKQNHRILKMDTAGFISMWGGMTVWGILTVLCLIVAWISFSNLPSEIPIQWEKGVPVSFADKRWIFVYPAVCMIIRFLLRPFIRRWVWIHTRAKQEVVDYLTNYLCFLAVSFEVFTVFFVHGIVRHVTVVFAVDTIVFFGILVLYWKKIPKKGASL